MNNKVSLHQPIPPVSFLATSHLQGSLADYLGKNVVLYFYPKDNTPGCTHESKDFRDYFDRFQKTGTVIFGISCDTLESHEKFKQKHTLPFELISDRDAKICNTFGVMNPKVIFGKKLFGIVRSTFLIDKKGILLKEWRKVNTKGHAEEVYQAALALL